MKEVKTSILYSYVVSFNLYSAGIYQIYFNPNIHISDLEIDNKSTYFHQMHMVVLNMSDAIPVVGQKDETHFKGIDTQPIKGN